MALDPSSALLTDRVAVVTGAARGIGRATALALARFGAHVAVCDRLGDELLATASEIEALGRRAVGGVFDVRDAEAVQAHVEEVQTEMGQVDILVNNAGGTFYANVLDVNDKGQLSIVHENFTSATNFIRAVVPLMPPEGGAIVNVTSVEAFQAAPGFGVYAAMKAALTSLTKTLALELADRNIRVNAVAPDAIPTPGDGPLAEATGDAAKYSATVVPPLGYFADADACAAPIVFLAGDLAKFLTGITIHVDGGSFAGGGWRRIGDDLPDYP